MSAFLAQPSCRSGRAVGQGTYVPVDRVRKTDCLARLTVQIHLCRASSRRGSWIQDHPSVRLHAGQSLLPQPRRKPRFGGASAFSVAVAENRPSRSVSRSRC